MKRQVSLAEEFQIVYEDTERVRGEGLHTGEAAKGSLPPNSERKPVCSNKDPAQPRVKIIINKSCF